MREESIAKDTTLFLALVIGFNLNRDEIEKCFFLSLNVKRRKIFWGVAVGRRTLVLTDFKIDFVDGAVLFVEIGSRVTAEGEGEIVCILASVSTETEATRRWSLNFY